MSMKYYCDYCGNEVPEDSPTASPQPWFEAEMVKDPAERLKYSHHHIVMEMRLLRTIKGVTNGGHICAPCLAGALLDWVMVLDPALILWRTPKTVTQPRRDVGLGMTFPAWHKEPTPGGDGGDAGLLAMVDRIKRAGVAPRSGGAEHTSPEPDEPRDRCACTHLMNAHADNEGDCIQCPCETYVLKAEWDARQAQMLPADSEDVETAPSTTFCHIGKAGVCDIEAHQHRDEGLAYIHSPHLDEREVMGQRKQDHGPDENIFAGEQVWDHVPEPGDLDAQSTTKPRQPGKHRKTLPDESMKHPMDLR